MKKFLFSAILALAAMMPANAQDFFGIAPEKFISLLEQAQRIPARNAKFVLGQTMELLSKNPKSYRKGLDTAIQRLSDPTDSIHNEELYIAVLNHAIDNYTLSNNEKMRPKALLESALKNRIGTVATDIDYITTDGKKHNLITDEAKYTLVYFNDPDCDACAKVKAAMAESTALKGAVDNGKLRVVAINPMSNEKLWKKSQFPEWITNGFNKSQSINDGTYDLPTLPVFYLLGTDNIVLLKNEASFKFIEKAVVKVVTESNKDSKTLADELFNK